MGEASLRERLNVAQRQIAELKRQNLEFSRATLEMSDRCDQSARTSHVDRLLSAVLLRRIGNRAELPFLEVDAVRREIDAPPGIGIYTTKDESQRLFVVTLGPNPDPDNGAASAPVTRKSSLILLS